MKRWWGKLTDDDIQYIAGSREKLAGILQERCGLNQQAAHERVEEFLEDLKERFKMHQV